MIFFIVTRRFKEKPENMSSKEVEASLDIEDVMSQTPCFSKTIAMNIALPSID